MPSNRTEGSHQPVSRPDASDITAKHYDVVMLGGGFAGATLVRQLERKLPKDSTIAMISRENFITYNPLLPEIVGASILPGHVIAPLRQIIKSSDFLLLEVSDINFADKIIYHQGECQQLIHYEHLVIGVGMQANLDLVPGMDQHALPLKTLGDALFMRNRIITRLEQASLQTDPEQRRHLTTFLIIGGGFSGVEVAGEICDFLRSALRYYRSLKAEECRVILVHSGEYLLPEISRRLGEFTQRKMQHQGIEIHLKARAARVDSEGVELVSGERIAASTVICTVGSAPNPLTLALGLQLEHGRIVTNPDMSVASHPGLWAIGDCASVPNACGDGMCPATAQFAVRQANQLATNLNRRFRGQATRAFRYKAIGQLSSIGHNKAVAEIYGLHISGFVAWLLWRGVYLLKIPTFARKVRIFFAWNWEMLFPIDIANLNFKRTPRHKQDTKQD
ncbi:MAG: NAD(P)/FAD-dependent oxidoreductase [Gammaproteobacteria bacterium]|nr:NAD(P)/FAD-dependent oxidoreductase [Gammaproteobacteria bacterium]